MHATRRWRRLLGTALALAVLGSVTASADRTTPTTDGVDFDLVDSSGAAYTRASFPPDKILVVYFGYTTCLRACPTTLDTIGAAIDDLGERSSSVQPIFVDLDPDRAAQANLPLYMESFGPTFLGLTGTRAAIDRAVGTFEVKVERLQFSDDPADYAMTHVSPIYLLRPTDAHPTTLPATASADELRSAINRLLPGSS